MFLPVTRQRSGYMNAYIDVSNIVNCKSLKIKS